MEFLKIQNAKTLFRDFSCNSSYHWGPEFCVRIDGRKAKKMEKDGWCIKKREINGKTIWFLPVAVYSRTDTTNPIEPKVYIRIDGDYENIKVKQHNGLEILDFATIQYAHLEIVGFTWTITHPYEKTGIKAYLKYGVFGIDPKIDAKTCLNVMNRR